LREINSQRRKVAKKKMAFKSRHDMLVGTGIKANFKLNSVEFINFRGGLFERWLKLTLAWLAWA
jgi:hypothetical protein